MRRFGRAARSALALLAALVVAQVAPLGAQQPMVSGRVTDKASGKPVAGARVSLLGTSIIETTNQDGRYTVRSAVSGTVRIRVNAIGYQSETRGSTVEGAPVTVDFALAAVAVQLDEVVSTATGETSKLEIGHSVATISADSVNEYNAPSNISDVLNSRVAGVTVQVSGGTAGTGSRIRIRGANSISLSNEPLLYVDGVRANQAPNAGDDISGSTGGQSFSRLNDINPDDIESIDILKGPSATTLYGVDAANGVIIVKTKRGVAGRTKWNVYAEGGLSNDRNNYPANYTAFGLRGGTQRAGCFLWRVDAGICAGQDSLVSFNPLKFPETTPFGTGYRQVYGLNVSGGSDRLQYYLSGDFNDEVGVMSLNKTYVDSLELKRGVTSLPFTLRRPNAIRRVNFRSTVHANVSSNADVTATFGYVNSDGRLPQNDNNFFGIISGGLLGGFSRNNAWVGSQRGGWGPEEVFAIQTRQFVQRATGSVSTNWHPVQWLTGRATVGVDQTQFQNISFSPTNEAPPFFDAEKGARTANKYTTSIYSLDAGLTGTKALGNFSSKTTVGLQYYRTSTNGSFANGTFLAPGSANVGGAAVQVAGESNVSSVTGGALLEQVFGYKERLFLNGGVRVDKASGFGKNFGSVFSPKANASYLAIDQRSGFLNSARLRVAYGQSSVQPGAFDAIAYFTAGPAAIDATGGKLAAITLGAIGNSNLKPERSREFEGGVDLQLLNNRVSIEFTAYDKRTSDALVNRPLAPSLGTGGATNQFVNLASVSNQGLELGFNARILTGRNLTFDLGLNGSLLRNKVLSLGQGIQPFFFGLGGSSQRTIAGYPIGGLWAPTVTVNDANGNGKIGLNEYTVAPEASFQGAVLPTRNLTILPVVTLFEGKIRIASTFDYRGGNYLNNSTLSFQCQFGICRDIFDPSTPIEEQAKALATSLFDGSTASFAFAQKADFLRWRELSVTFVAPASIAKSLGADRASLTIAGRNLWITTKYGGIDPEVNTSGQTNQSVADFLSQPPVRSWTARFNLSF